MRLTKRLTWRVGSAAVLVGSLLGCSQLVISMLNVSIADIDEVQKNRNTSSIVYLKGSVKERAPFLGSGAYQLQDTTGSIWVVSDRALPKQGTQLTIKGKVEYKSIPVAGTEVGEVYIKELDKL